MADRWPGRFAHGTFLDECGQECFGISATTGWVGDFHQCRTGIESTQEDQAIVPLEDETKIGDICPIEAETTLDERMVHDTPATKSATALFT